MKSALRILLCASACTAALALAAQGIVVGLITKTETNPFFVKMKEGAAEAAKAKGAKLLTAAGKFDGDNAGQVTAIENMIAAGAKAILITPSDTKAIVPAIKKARDAGVMVIALDTPDRSAERHRRAVRHRQLQGRRADRPVRQGRDGRQAGQDRDARSVRPASPGRRAAPQRLPEGLRRSTRSNDSPSRSSAARTRCGDQAKGQTAMENCLQKSARHQRRLHDQRAGRGRRLSPR